MTSGPVALIVADVQLDFCEGGRLAVTGGAAAAAGISDLIEAAGDAYSLLVASRDWHIDPGRHFAPEGEPPDYIDVWPAHCVAGTEGADFHPDLRLPPRTVIVSKGHYSAAYSAFQGVTDDGLTLADLLRRVQIARVDLVGIATSYCVKATALDAVQAGLATRVLAPLTADINAAAAPATFEDLRRKGVTIAG